MLDVDNTLLDNDRIVTDLGIILRRSLATRVGITIGKFSKRRAMSSAMQTIWETCNATALKP